jgi:hypothetical protein
MEGAQRGLTKLLRGIGLLLCTRYRGDMSRISERTVRLPVPEEYGRFMIGPFQRAVPGGLLMLGLSRNSLVECQTLHRLAFLVQPSLIAIFLILVKWFHKKPDRYCTVKCLIIAGILRAERKVQYSTVISSTEERSMRSVAGDLLSRMLLEIVMYVSNQLGFIMCCELNASYIARMCGKMNLITFFAAESHHEGLTSLPPVPKMWSYSDQGR